MSAEKTELLHAGVIQLDIPILKKLESCDMNRIWTMIVISAVIFISAVVLISEKSISAKQGAKKMNTFSIMDMDGNDTISSKEWIAYNTQIFTVIDNDGSGELTRDELRAFHEKKRNEQKNEK